jgi:hypothetical protein
MTDVGDAIELTYATAPGAAVTVSWIYLPTGTVIQDEVAVPELISDGIPTGQYPVTLVGTQAGMYEARFTASGAATNSESYFERFDENSGIPPLATLGEYTELYGNLSAARSATARALLRRASQLVRDSFPGIDAKILAGTVPGNSVGVAVLNMVARVMRNPQGLRSETTGPFSRAYDADAASGMLEITAADAGLLVPPESGGRGARGRMGTLRVTGGMVPPVRRRGWRHGPMFGPGGH